VNCPTSWVFERVAIVSTNRQLHNKPSEKRKNSDRLWVQTKLPKRLMLYFFCSALFILRTGMEFWERCGVLGAVWGFGSGIDTVSEQAH
jgi:hypothetical protein